MTPACPTAVSPRRVVVVGMGAVSPIGVGVEAFWKALLRGECGIRPLTGFDTNGFSYARGGEIPEADRLLRAAASAGAPDRATAFMLHAAREALAQAGLAAPPRDDEHLGVVVATNFGGLATGERFLEEVLTHRPVSREAFEEYNFQRAADQVAAACGALGPRLSLSLSCASGAAALGYGLELIRQGRARRVLAGGYDALSRIAWSGLSALRTMTSDQVRPFDRRRNGTIFSEGAAAVVLEDEATARERGVRPLAELAGYGLTNNAFHMTAPDKAGEGLAEAMRAALRDAGVRPDEVDHVNAHGTGTRYNDATETLAIKAVLGEHARRIPITSIKGSVGHMMGAAGTVEAIAAVLSLRDGVIPPTLHYAEADPDCDLNCVVNRPRAAGLRTVVSNSAGIGGCNAVVVLRRMDHES